MTETQDTENTHQHRCGCVSQKPAKVKVKKESSCCVLHAGKKRVAAVTVKLKANH